ncbi:MAG: hypothetical protein AAF224_05595 [Pseudomonadota bacterium]
MATFAAMVGFAAILGVIGATAIILRKLNMHGAASALIGIFAVAVILCAAGLSFS